MNTILAHNIKFIREYLDLTQQEFGEFLKATRSMILSYERGIAQPKALILNKIAELAQISVSLLTNTKLEISAYENMIDSKAKESTSGKSTLLPLNADTPPMFTWPDREKQLRLECLKLAVQMKMNTGGSSSDITKMADEFVKWVNGEAE